MHEPKAAEPDREEPADEPEDVSEVAAPEARGSLDIRRAPRTANHRRPLKRPKRGQPAAAAAPSCASIAARELGVDILRCTQRSRVRIPFYYVQGPGSCARRCGRSPSDCARASGEAAVSRAVSRQQGAARFLEVWRHRAQAL